jgi:hypothetical protein
MTGIRSQIEYYVRALRAPRISDGFGRLGDAAWSHEEYWPRSSLVKFPNAKPQELRQLRPSALRGPEPHRAPAHRGVPLRSQKRGPPRATGTGKTHLAVGIGIKAAKAGHRVLFDSVTAWFARLQEVHSRGKLCRNWSNSTATAPWWSTTSVTSRSIRKPRTCSSSSSRAAMNTRP